MELKPEKNKHYITEIIKLFVVKEKQDRFFGFLESFKRYDDLLDELFIDSRNLDQRYLIEIAGYQRSTENILTQLKKLGAGKQAYVLSVIDNVDGKLGNLQEVVFSEVGKGIGTIIYCAGTPIGYYENDEDFRYILYSRNKLIV